MCWCTWNVLQLYHSCRYVHHLTHQALTLRISETLFGSSCAQSYLFHQKYVTTDYWIENYTYMTLAPSNDPVYLLLLFVRQKKQMTVVFHISVRREECYLSTAFIIYSYAEMGDRLGIKKWKCCLCPHRNLSNGAVLTFSHM